MKLDKNQVDNNNTVFIIDGSYFLFRAYYSKRNFTKDGLPVGAIYGFCKMLKKLINSFKPVHLLLVWDSKGKTHRHEIFKDYKANRDVPPNDYTEQKELAISFADSIKLAQIFSPGIEADDLMYSMAKNITALNDKVILVTADKDLTQILDENIAIFDPFKEKFITKEILEEDFGFCLSKLPFYYALTGDTSDNIPGVKGIGPKGAKDLVKKFNSLTDLFDNLDKVESPRIRSLLNQYKENAFLSEQLFKLRLYPVSLSKKACLFNVNSWSNILPFFEKLGLDDLITDTIKTKASKNSLDISNYILHNKYEFILVNSSRALDELCQEINKYKLFAVDTEGIGLNPLTGKMVGLSICVNEGKAYYIPFGHSSSETQLTKRKVISALRPLLEDENIKKILHHAKFDSLMFHAAGIDLKGIIFDTLIASSLLMPGQSIGLKSLSLKLLNEPMLSFDNVVKGQGYKYFSQVPLQLATNYAAADAHQTMRIYALFKQHLEDYELSELFFNLEMPLMEVLIDMEKEGICLDTSILKKIDIEITKDLNVTSHSIKNLLDDDYEINLNSPKQVEKLLFKDLKLPFVKLTQGKTSYSTDHEVLAAISHLHPIPSLIIRYRELVKLKTGYIEQLSKYINRITGRIHSSFNQARVITGRLASSNPNLQNIPIDQFNIRAAFKPKENNVFLAIDYSQIELRVLAYFSQDENLLEAFRNNKDVHAITAAGIFNVEIDKVTSKQRQVGKTINFGILYGLTPHGLSKDLSISLGEAKVYIEQYWLQFPSVKSWMNMVIEKTKEKGYVETFLGRRRYIPEIHERNKTLYDLGCRYSINTIAQGTASEIVKLGMINLHKEISANKLNAKILLQIHDELLIQVPESEIEKTKAIVKNCLENVVSWNVPLPISIKTGINWQEASKT